MRHDFRLLAADKTLWIITALFVVLIGYGTFNGARWTNLRLAAAQEFQEKGEKNFNRLKTEAIEYESGAKPVPTTTPEAFAPTGKNHPVALPPSQLTVLSIGQSDIYPYSATVDIYTSKHAVFNFYEQDNPLNLLAGRFDLAFVFVFLFPLLILAISYNLLSAEKENGTLAMTLAQSPLGLGKLLAGKILIRLLVVLTLAVSLTLVGLLISGVNIFAPDVLPRLLLWTAAIGLYACFWFALAALVNAFGYSSATNAMILAGAWILLVVVSPAVLSVAATTLHPTPSRLEFVSKQREADNYTRSAGEKLLGKYYGDHPELVPAGQLDLNDFTRRFYAVRQEMQRRMLPEVEQFERQLQAQQTLLNRYRILSPPVILQDALNDIAGTSTARQKTFVAQIHGFIEDWQAFFVPRVMRKENLKAADYETIPRFGFREESNAAIFNRVGAGLLLLLIPILLVVGLIVWRLRRFPLIG